MGFKNFNQVLLNNFSLYAKHPALMFKSGDTILVIFTTPVTIVLEVQSRRFYKLKSKHLG